MSSKQMPRKFPPRGFSLVELMIVVVVIGILAAVALPSYNTYLVKGRRAAAQTLMMDVASKEKQYLLDARAYTTSLATAGVTVPTDIATNYTVTVAVGAAPPTFTVTATPVVGGLQASDGTLALTSDGAKTPSDKW